MLQDNLLFTDEKTGDQVIFNHYSFCEMLKWIIVKYASKTYEDASKLVDKSFLINEPTSYLSVALTTHELEFHWAMLIAHGDMYWLKGIPSDYNDFFEEYDSWDREIRDKYNLKDSYIYLDD